MTRIQEPGAVLDDGSGLLCLSAVSLSLLVDAVLQDLLVCSLKLLKIQLFKKLADCLGTHTCCEAVTAVLCHKLFIFLFRKDFLVFDSRNGSLVDDNIGLILEDGVEVCLLHAKKVAHDGRLGLVEPDVGYRSSKLDVSASLSSDLLLCDFYTTALTLGSLISLALELSAPAFPVSCCTEDTLAEESIPLRSKGAVVDCLRLLNFTIGPGTNLFRGRNLYS